MRLALLRKLEARASTVKRAAAGAGIVWSRDDPRVTRELEPGELAAADMPVAVAEGESPAVVLDASDLGFVHDAAGLVAGRMTEVDGSLAQRAPRSTGAGRRQRQISRRAAALRLVARFSGGAASLTRGRHQSRSHDGRAPYEPRASRVLVPSRVLGFSS